MPENRQEIYNFMADNITSAIARPQSGSLIAQMDPHQIEIMRSTASGLYDGEVLGRVKSPTGTGKTWPEIATMQVAGGRSVWVGPTHNLMDQMAKRIKELAPDLESFGQYDARRKLVDRQVILTTYASVPKLLGPVLRPDDIDLIIWDEAHHLNADRARAVSRLFKDVPQVGSSATPDFGINRQLAELLPRNIFSMSIREAVERDIICSFSVMLYMTGIDINNVEVMGTGLNRQYNQEQLARTLDIPSRNKAAVDIFKDNFEGHQGITYCLNLAHADEMAYEYRNEGIRAAMVYGKQKDTERDQILRDLDAGKLDVVTSARLLIEGADHPRVSVVENLVPRLSPVDVEQSGGRSLRIPRGYRGKYAFIIEFVDTARDPNKMPLSFATQAEAARILNSWHKHEGLPKELIHPRVSSHLRGSRFLTTEKEVMYVANREYAEFTPEGMDGYYTLRRFAAEAGIPAGAMSFYLDNYPHMEGSRKLHDIETITTPLGNQIDMYNPYFMIGATAAILESHGVYEPYGGEPMHTTTDQEIAFIRGLRKKTYNVDKDFLLKYHDKLVEYIKENNL